MKSTSFLIFIFLPVASATFLLVNCAFHDLSEPDDSMIVSDDIKISEVMTSNSSLFYDQFNETPDWIELYNSGDSAIDLAGYSLTDDPDQPEKWTCGSIVIAKIESMAAAIQSEIPRDFARWEKPVSQWEHSVTGLKNWAKYRPDGMRKNYVEFFSLAGTASLTLAIQGRGGIDIDGFTPATYPFTGAYFKGNPILITAVPGSGTFKQWSDGITEKSRTIELGDDLTLTAQFD